jgi:hypothetical protein
MDAAERRRSQERQAEYVRRWQAWDRRATWHIRIGIAAVVVMLAGIAVILWWQWPR